MIGEISFEPLSELHFSHLLLWLQTPHVKATMDQDIQWDEDHIKAKCSSLIKGYKLVNNQPKSIQPYIINFALQPVGYIQLYNLRDFLNMPEFNDLPDNLLAIDFFIGDQGYLKKGIGSRALRIFLDQYIDKQHTHVFVAAHLNNIAAIKTYLACGFKEAKIVQNEIWMLINLS